MCARVEPLIKAVTSTLAVLLVALRTAVVKADARVAYLWAQA